eukprot:5230145-Pleurochrysis_carterae.AAC.2
MAVSGQGDQGDSAALAGGGRRPGARKGPRAHTPYEGARAADEKRGKSARIRVRYITAVAGAGEARSQRVCLGNDEILDDDSYIASPSAFDRFLQNDQQRRDGVKLPWKARAT